MSFDDIISKEFTGPTEVRWRICGNCKRYAPYPEEENKSGYCHIKDSNVAIGDGYDCVDHI